MTSQINIYYGVIRAFEGGYAPHVTEGKRTRGFASTGTDYEIALAEAKEIAQEYRSRYIGDQTVTLIHEYEATNS